MSNTVKNEGLSLNLNVGGAVKLNLNIGGSAKVSEQQGRDIFQQLNQNFEGRSPRTARDAIDTQQNTPQNQKHNNSEGPKNNQNQPNIDRGAPERGEPGRGRAERGENGRSNASEQGLLNGQGHQKTKGQGNNPPPNRTNPPLDFPNDNQGNQNQKTGGNEGNQSQKPGNTPPILPPVNTEVPVENLPKPNTNLPNPHSQKQVPVDQQPNQNQIPNQNQLPNQNGQEHRRFKLDPNQQGDDFFDFQANQRGNSHDNRQNNVQNNVLRQVLSQVLRQNDIYVNNGTLNKLIHQNQTSQNGNQLRQNQPTLPREVSNLVQNISSRVINLLDNSQPLNGKTIHEAAIKISLEIQTQLDTTKNIILRSAELETKHFKQLNIVERMIAAVELMPRHLPSEMAQNLQLYDSREVLNALLLTRGLIAGQEKTADLRNLVASAQTPVFTQNISMTAMRDVGQLVKILISEAALVKSTANLDLSVQKFIRILIANNELGVLLATISLASQARDGGGLISRSLALAQIYELINRLIAAGEKAMKQAMPEMKPVMPEMAKPFAAKTEKSVLAEAAVFKAGETEEGSLAYSKTHGSGAESSLRQFLEFNPAFVFDNSASAFQSSEDARQAQKDFVNLYQNDIDSWLKSGNHRFVKEIDFDKPVGVVVERSSDGLFTASSVRIVLVRDGSVQGWHFLKSFLVK